MGSRIYCFTWNIRPDDESLPIWHADAMHYMLYQQEVAPTTGQLHLQGVVKFKKPQRLPGAKRLLGAQHVHLEACRNWTAAKEYCKKEESRVPGTVPTELGEDVTQGQRCDVEAVVELVKSGAGIRQIAEAQPVTFMRFHRGIRELRLALQTPPAIHRKAVLLQGATGVGKTRFVMDNFTEIYNVFDMRAPWFDGYDGQKVVLLDECGSGMMHYNILKQLTDRYPFQVPVKGGSAPWMAEIIFLTSNESLQQWYPNLPSVHLDALERRIKVFTLPHEAAQLAEYMKDDIAAQKAHKRHCPEPSVTPTTFDILSSDDEPEVVGSQLFLPEADMFDPDLYDFD